MLLISKDQGDSNDFWICGVVGNRPCGDATFAEPTSRVREDRVTAAKRQHVFMARLNDSRWQIPLIQVKMCAACLSHIRLDGLPYLALESVISGRGARVAANLHLQKAPLRLDSEILRL